MARQRTSTGIACKENSGIYRGKALARRIPLSVIPFLDHNLANAKHGRGSTLTALNPCLQAGNSPGTAHDLFPAVPLFASRVPAGFPSPADDFIEDTINLNQHLVAHPASTFFVRASGDSMIQAGIHTNDILVVDRSLEAVNGSIVIAAVNGELTVKRLEVAKDQVALLPENPAYSPLPITEETDFSIWGVVTAVIHQFRA